MSNPTEEGINARTRSRILTRQRAKLLESSENPVVEVIESSPRCRKLVKPVHSRRAVSKHQNLLSTDTFEYHLEHLWSEIPEENKTSYAYLDSLWFSLYKEGPSKSKVLEWIKKKNIFERKFVFVPVVCWRHWSLLILCNFGESGQARTKNTCMLLLDSLHEADPKRLEPDIRRFVLDIYRSEGRTEKDESISKIPLLIPPVPQQKNGEECGIFVLYFFNLFIRKAPLGSTIEDYPYFLNKDWFKLEELESFRKDLASLSMCKDVMNVD